MNDLTAVTINVPTELALDFQDAAHTVLARLRQGLPALPSEDERPSSAPHRVPTPFRPLDPASARQLDVHTLPVWGTDEDDHLRAAWVIESLHPDQVGIVASMARHAGDRISGDAIGEETTYDGARSVAPALRGLAQRCRRVRRNTFWLFHRDTPGGQGTYEMEEHVAALFAPALDEARPGWRDE